MFKKAIVCTDQHFSRSGGLERANQDNVEFFEWFIEEGKTWGADTVILCGDYFDSRDSVKVLSLEYGMKALELLSVAFPTVYILKGNHDLVYRAKRDASSMSFAKHIPNIRLVSDPLTIGQGKDGVTFLPWLIGDEVNKIKNIKSRYIFSHIEAGGFKMNANVELPETETGLKSTSFVNQEYAFSGHFHLRQQKNNVVYIGNIMPFNFGDDWSEDKGMMFLEWGKDPFFKAWPMQPLFRTMRLSELLNKPQALLKDRMTARVAIDIDISYEEAQIIKETFITDYGLRRLELTHQSKNNIDDQDFIGNVTYQSVDQIVVDGLLSVQSIDMKPEKLVEIYKSLPNL